jgi:hypothetical protein
LLLHINNKACQVSATGAPATLSLRVARKFDQSADQAYPIEFLFSAASASPHHFHSELTAANGPLGTSDYRILLEAIPVPPGRSFVRLSYSYRQGGMTGAAMSLYFATVGANKVGFTVVGLSKTGEPDYIGGVRGLIERNTMRYFLALETYLTAPPEIQANGTSALFSRWFEATERYPRQLHETDMQGYLSGKGIR